MKKGDYIKTPRFLKVKLEEVFNSKQEAYKEGYTEPTHYNGSEYEVLGKHTGLNRMKFAAARK